MNRVILGIAVLLLLVGGVIWVSRFVERARPRTNITRFSPLPSMSSSPYQPAVVASPSVPALTSPYPSVSPILPRSGLLPATGI